MAARATLIVSFVIGRWHRYAKSGFKINPSQDAALPSAICWGKSYRGCPHAYRLFRPARRRQHTRRRFAPVHGPGGGLTVTEGAVAGPARRSRGMERGQYAVNVCSYELAALLAMPPRATGPTRRRWLSARL